MLSDGFSCDMGSAEEATISISAQTTGARAVAQGSAALDASKSVRPFRTGGSGSALTWDGTSPSATLPP